MIPRTTKQLCILADADVIIELHSLGIWDQFTIQCKVVTTDYIQQNEAKYFKSNRGNFTVAIDLSSYIQNGQISTLSANASDLVPIYETFNTLFLDTLDQGEIEAIALIIAGKNQNAILCSGDGPAIQAMAMIGKSAAVISLQKVLEKTGFTRSVRSLQHNFLEDNFEKHKSQGSQKLITGSGLKKKPF